MSQPFVFDATLASTTFSALGIMIVDAALKGTILLSVAGLDGLGLKTRFRSDSALGVASGHQLAIADSSDVRFVAAMASLARVDDDGCSRQPIRNALSQYAKFESRTARSQG